MHQLISMGSHRESWYSQNINNQWERQLCFNKTTHKIKIWIYNLNFDIQTPCVRNRQVLELGRTGSNSRSAICLPFDLEEFSFDPWSVLSRMQIAVYIVHYSEGTLHEQCGTRASKALCRRESSILIYKVSVLINSFDVIHQY